LLADECDPHQWVSKASAGDRRKKLFQFLTEVGPRALARQLGRVLEMAESSSNKAEYEQKIVKRFAPQREFDLTIPAPPTAVTTVRHSPTA
jgi:hypothetical protein